MSVFRNVSLSLAIAVCVIQAFSPTPAVSQEAQTITYQQLLDYLRLEVKEEKILKMIAASPTSFSLGADQIAKLKEAGASEKIIAALSKPAAAGIGDQVSDIRDFVVILDCSASMRDEAQPGVSKWESAQKSAADLIRAVPNQRRLAFIVYGHDIALRCKSIEVIRNLTPITDDAKDDLVLAIAKIKPSADTPIGASLNLAKSLLVDTNELAKVILITDGMESCKGDPVAEAAQLATLKHVQGGVDVIGFGLKQNEIDPVERIAQAGKGKFYNADSVNKLRESVSDVERAINKPIVRPKDESGLTALDRLLIKNLADKDVKVRGSAAVTIGKRKLVAGAAALADLITNDLWDENQTVNDTRYDFYDGSKDLALKALLDIDRKAAENALGLAVKSKIAQVSCWASEMIEKHKVLSATDALASIISNADWKQDQRVSGENYIGKDACKERAFVALKKLDAEKLEQALLKAAESEIAPIRAWATDKLSTLAADPK